MKTKIADLSQRLTIKESKTEGILNFDLDNAYPQRMGLIAAGSGTATICLKTYGKFIEGAGFSDQLFYKAKVNDRGLTNDKLLRKISKDFAKYAGFAIHVNYNALFKITEVNYVAFETVRMGDPCGEFAGKYALYDDWARLVKKNIKKDDIDWVHPYNPDPAIIALQISECGGFDNYNGQLFYFGNEYPLAVYDSVIEDVDTDGEIKVFRNTIVRKGFSPDVVFVTRGKFEDDEEEEEFDESLERFQGPENAASIIHVNAETEEQVPQILPFPKVENDTRYTETTRTTKDSIIEVFGIPPILLGVQVSGKLGTAGEILDAQTFYNSYTDPERRAVEEVFADIFKRFHIEINPTNDYSIIPFEIIKQNKNNREVLATTLGVGGVTALTGLIADPTIGEDQKINTIVILFGISKEDATSMVKGTPLINVQ